MSTRKWVYLAIGLLVVSVIVDVAFVHAHYPVWYHELHGFEVLFGLVGAFVLMFVSLGLGNLLLWKTTCSVLLEPEMAGSGADSARLRKWFVTDGDRVKSGAPLVELETDRGASFVVVAPYDGKVTKCFIDEMGCAEVGESVVDLQVSKHAMEHGKEEEGHA